VFAVTVPAVSTPAEVIVAGPEVMLKVAPVAAAVVPSLQVAVAVYVAVVPSFTEDGPTIAMLLNVAGAAAIAMERAFVEERPLAPATRTVKLEVPAAVGVPLIAPEEAFSVRPAGRLPAETDQLYGVVPPVAVSVWL
jgi:hypothetical protein